MDIDINIYMDITIDNLIKSIDMYKSLIIITSDVNLNLTYIDCLLKLENDLNTLFKIVIENQEKYPNEYNKYHEYHSKRKLKMILKK